MMDMRRMFGAALLGALLVSCGDGPVEPEPDPTVTGSWQGPLDSSTVLGLVLSEGADGAVSGSGSFTGALESVALVVESGTHVFPDLSLVLGATGFESMNLTGTVHPSFIEGRLSGSGFLNDDIVLVRR